MSVLKSPWMVGAVEIQMAASSSYSWIQTSGPAVTLNNADTSTPTFTAPNVSADSMLQFLLTVKDNRGATSNNSAIVSVTVKAPVQKPSMVVAPINTTAPAQPTGNVTAPPTSNVTAPPTSNVGWMLGQGKVAFDLRQLCRGYTIS